MYCVCMAKTHLYTVTARKVDCVEGGRLVVRPVHYTTTVRHRSHLSWVAHKYMRDTYGDRASRGSSSGANVEPVTGDLIWYHTVSNPDGRLFSSIRFNLRERHDPNNPGHVRQRICGHYTLSGASHCPLCGDLRLAERLQHKEA